MGSAGPLIVLSTSIFCSLVSLACFITGCYSNTWWVIDGANLKSEAGLWRTCRKFSVGSEICTKRDSLFDFNGPLQSSAKDTILVVLMAAAVFCFLAFLSSVLMYCYQRRCDSWRCAALVAFSIGLIGALAGFGALGYAEYEFEKLWKTSDHGFGVILTWVGAAAQLLAASLCGVLVCVVPTQNSGKHQVHYVGNTNPTYQSDYAMR